MALGAAALFLVSLAYGTPPEKIAYSKTYGADVYVVDHGEDWCDSNISTIARMRHGSVVGDRALDAFYRMIGMILQDECPKAKKTSFLVLGADGEYFFAGECTRDDGWTPARTGFGLSEGITLMRYHTTIFVDAMTARFFPGSYANRLEWLGIGGFVVVFFAAVLFLCRKKEQLSTLQDHESEPESNQVEEVAPYESVTVEDGGMESPKPKLVASTVFAESYEAALEGKLSEDPKERAGDYGEALVLSKVMQAGGGIVYWGLGLSNRGRKCEVDILIVAPHGLLHVEVKNLSGVWKVLSEYDEQGRVCSSCWTRDGDGDLTMRSPVEQANRARAILAETVRNLTDFYLPIHSVVVAAHGEFSLSGAQDDGVKVMSLSEFDEFYKEYAHGSIAQLSAARRGLFASLVEHVAGYGQRPAFFDLELFEEGARQVPDQPMSMETYENYLFTKLSEYWSLKTRIPKQDGIWFGNKQDMAPASVKNGTQD
jgi:hypothetical protein